MLGAAGCLAVEALGFGNWFDAPLWAINGGKATWFGIDVPFDLNSLLAFEFVAMAAAESQRGNEADAAKRCYPGGAFDPLGFAKGDVEALKLKEVKNGRLVRGACFVFVCVFVCLLLLRTWPPFQTNEASQQSHKPPAQQPQHHQNRP